MIQKRLFESVAMPVRKRLKERTLGSVDASSRIDREAGVIRDCAILGSDSANERVYEETALDRAVELYEGKIVRINHRPMEKRDVLEDIGVIRNARRAGDKVRGDFHFIKAHEKAEYFCERAERFPETFGFSHEADGTVEEGADGKEHVLDLIYVESVDLVGTPATNKSLFEEEQTMVRKSIRSIVRGVPVNTPGRKRMLEMIGDPAMDGDVEVDAKATPEAQLDASLKAAVQAILNNGDISVEDKLSQIKSLCGDSIPESTVPPVEKPVEKPPEKPPVTESAPPAGSEPKPGEDAKAMTEAIENRLRAEFSSKFEVQEARIKTLTEQNSENAKKVQAAEAEKQVRRIFEESGVKSPTEDQVSTAMALSGRARATFIDTVKQLVESQAAGGQTRVSGGGDDDAVGDYPSREKFISTLKA